MIKATTLLQQFIEINRWNYEEATIEVFELAFRNFVEAVGNREITRITSQDGERFKGYVVQTDRQKSSANIWLRAIKRVFRWAVETNLLNKNPIADIKQFRITQNPVKFFTDSQVKSMIQFAPDLRRKAIILCAWTTGLRRGAILNMTLNNVRNGFVHVEAKRKSKTTWPWEPKTREVRQVPLVAQLHDMIEQLSDCHYPFLSQERYEYLLRMQEAGTMTARQRKCPEENLLRTLIRIQKRAFGRQIGDFHQFRKTYTTNMAESLPEHVVMKLTGHRCRNTLTHYTAVRRSFYQEALKIASERAKNNLPFCGRLPQKEGGHDIRLSG